MTHNELHQGGIGYIGNGYAYERVTQAMNSAF